MTEEANRLQKLLSFAIQNNASDIHLRAEETPVFRIRGELVPVRMRALAEEDLLGLARSAMGAKFKHGATEIQEQDFSFEFSGVARFRGNVFRQDGRLAVVLRIIPHKVPTIDQLGLPPILKQITLSDRGLVLVTGATGCGKSTTLAAMIEELNESRAIHIVTVEDPVEFVHQKKKAQITRREVGKDTAGFSSALRSVLRQDPDVILIGELRDRESIDIALKAAETGHLVFSTVHTNDAPKTIAKLVSMFPGDEQQAARRRLADNLLATIAQKLVPRADGKGLVCAQEIMLNNTAIHECISDGAKTSEMLKYIEAGYGPTGSQSLDQHLLKLYRAGVITQETAVEHSPGGEDFKKGLYYQDSGESSYAKKEEKEDTGSSPRSDSPEERFLHATKSLSRVELDVRVPDPAQLKKPEPKPPQTLEKPSQQKGGNFMADGLLALKKLAGGK